VAPITSVTLRRPLGRSGRSRPTLRCSGPAASGALLNGNVIGQDAMSYFEDLTTYEYSGKPNTSVLNVGWLGEGHPFDAAETADAFRTALKELCDTRWMNKCRGHHVCEFCPGTSWGDPYFHEMGNGEIRVRSASGTWYVAPRLVFHYVAEHNYCPPKDFIDAVMNPIQIGSDEQLVSEAASRKRMWEAQPPITEQEIDRIVKQGILATRTRRPWWQFW